MFDTRSRFTCVTMREASTAGLTHGRARCFLYSLSYNYDYRSARTCASVVLYLALEIVGTSVKGGEGRGEQKEEGRKDGRISKVKKRTGGGEACGGRGRGGDEPG